MDLKGGVCDLFQGTIIKSTNFYRSFMKTVIQFADIFGPTRITSI